MLEKFSNAPAKALDKDQRPVEFTDRSDGGAYNYYQAVRAKQDCLQCHLALGTLGGGPLTEMNSGDLMAVAKITFPDADMQKALNENRAILLATSIITTFLAMVASFLVLRYAIIGGTRHPSPNKAELLP